MSNENTARKFFEERIYNKGFAKGFAEGFAECFTEVRADGRFKVAVNLVDKFGLDAVAEISGFSREKLLKAKLSK